MNLGIVGPGRAGIGLGLALAGAGHHVRVHGRRRKTIPPPLVFSAGERPPWLAEVDVVLLAVRDDDVRTAAESLAGVTERHVVLHLSGMLDHTALASLRTTGAALGSMHPLQAIADPARAPERLRGALAVLEGDDRAVAAGRRLADDLGMVPVVLTGGDKVRYHAGAVIASNYLVVLETYAERVFAGAGLPDDAARAGLTALMRGTLDNVADQGGAALTGPIVRGDVETVRRHLDTLEGETRALYVALARAALALAPDLPDARRRALTGLLDD